ncbi:hypothetical protein BCU68_03945 [Vibrio sp. 10N.286.49.B3]|uniref:Lpp/OprI family alanine-zipper lipoprotein n=1 Tax=Vibrio sp. 10N.286.49.B3 TaxID=1880855 RepID=UPI000C860627|nr:Lpp/OprI family alanine-zipper lipoprotein [Vibrio sp. 10N.286.49.B3]PMH43150.1 hypothetical protein BCU68_03945 [Vibrio sp. 10N.286.49.B3]
MNKTLIAVAAASVFVLAGCSSSDKVADVGMSELQNQVAQLSQEVSALKSEQKSAEMKASEASQAAMTAKEDAERANDRIDNIARSYTK